MTFLVPFLNFMKYRPKTYAVLQSSLLKKINGEISDDVMISMQEEIQADFDDHGDDNEDIEDTEGDTSALNQMRGTACVCNYYCYYCYYCYYYYY